MLPTMNYVTLICIALVSWMSLPAHGLKCKDLRVKDPPLEVYNACMNETVLAAEWEYKLDVSQFTQQQLDTLLAKVKVLKKVAIVSKESQLRNFHFLALETARDVRLELWNNHLLERIQFPVLNRNGSTFRKINVRGNENLKHDAIEHLKELPKTSGAETGRIQEQGECFHGVTGLSRFESSMTTVDSANWNNFRKCRFHSGDIQFSPTLLDYHGGLFGNTFKNISGCILVKNTYLSNINFLGDFSRYCEEWRNKERGVYNNSRLCLSKEQDRRIGSLQALNRDPSCRHRCYQASNGSLVAQKRSSFPCRIIEGSLNLHAGSPLEYYDDVRHVYGHLRFTGTKLKSIQLPKLQGVGFGCQTSIEIVGNADLEGIDLGSFISNGWLGPKEPCLPQPPRIIIKHNRYRIPDSERPKWLGSFPKVDFDIDFKMPPEEPTSPLWYITVVVVPLLLVVAAKLMYDYYDNVRTLNCRPQVPWIKDLENGSASSRSKEQLLLWIKSIIPETYLGWRHMGYLQLNVHNGSQEVLHNLNDEEKDKTIKNHERLKKKYAKLVKKIPPISLLPNPLNAPCATETEFNERFEMYKKIATQKEDIICLMYDDQFVRDAGRMPLTRVPFRLKDETNPLPRVNQRSVKDSDGNTVLDKELRIPIKEKISFQFLGVQPTTDAKKCRKVELSVETELWDSEKKRLVVTHRRMFLLQWATFSYNSPPTSPHDIATLLTLRNNLWNHSMRLWVFSGMAHEFHLNFQMLFWTVLTAKDSNTAKIGFWSLVDLTNAISTGFDGGFNLNMWCYSLHSIVSLAFKNKLISRNDPKYFETGDWLALADRADPVMRFLRTGSLYLEDVAPPPEMYNRIVNHPRFNMVLTFSVHTKMRGGVPVHRWPNNFWISFGRFPKTLLPVHKFPRVEFLDFNRDYSVPWMPIRKRLRESRRLTLAEMDLLHTLNRRPAIKIGQLALEPVPQEDAMLVIHDAMKKNKKKDDTKKKVVVGKVTKGKMAKGVKKMKKEADKSKVRKMSEEFGKKVKKGTKALRDVTKPKSVKRKEESKPKAINVDLELGLAASNTPTKPPGHGFAVMVVDETQRE